MYHTFVGSREALDFIDTYNKDKTENLAKLVAWPYGDSNSKFMVFCPKDLKKH